MAHKILENEIKLMLPQITSKSKWGIITALVLSFIELAYEGISSFCTRKNKLPYTKQLGLWTARQKFNTVS